MSISLDPAVLSALDSGRYVIIHLVRFDLSGQSVGYWRGARDFTWNGFVYHPSRYLDDSGLVETLGLDTTERSLTFSGVPTSGAGDVIAGIERHDYLNAPVTVTRLVADVETDEIPGIGESCVYEIHQVHYQKGAIDGDGERQVSVRIDLEIPGRVVRDSVGGKYSNAEHQAHNGPEDTFFEGAATSAAFREEWGQSS